MPAAGEAEHAPSVARAVWEAAGARAKSEGLPLIWVMSRTLTEYAAGDLPLPHTTTSSKPGDRRGRSVFATDDVWSRADERRTRDAVRSMSALCEILLDAYARGDIHPCARIITTDQRDVLSNHHVRIEQPPGDKMTTESREPTGPGIRGYGPPQPRS